MPTPIQKLVVLMLENRSFDHMLGFLQPTRDPVDNLLGKNLWNRPADPMRPNVAPSPTAGDVQDLDPDPNHDFPDVKQQIFNSDGIPDMCGFVGNYFNVCNDAVHAENVMRCFDEARLPILSALAKNYAICDRWFSSVPGSTIPNRMFVHGASSAGSVSQDAIAAPFVLHTIFESFDASTIHDYRIYHSGASILMANKYLVLHQGKFASYSDQFESDILHGNNPAYVFIEPAYDDDNDGNFANSQHPDFPVDRGEALIAEIYNILVKSPYWKSTLFLILYDEHGGLYDHVVPPTLTCLPENTHLPVPNSGAPYNFDFTRLGIRVPAVFISPCIRAGTVISDQNYEHSSVVATVRKLFCNPASQPLTWREAQAPTFESVLTLEGDDIRKDVVNLPDVVIAPPLVDIHAGAELRQATDLSVLMARTMQYSLQQRGIASPGDPSTMNTAGAIADYFAAAQARSAAAAEGGDQ